MSPVLAGRFLYTVPLEKSLTTFTLRILLLFVYELFLLKLLSEEISHFLCPVLAGRILNRFSKDIGHMDDLLPQTFQDFIQVMYQSCRVLTGNSRVPVSQGHFRGADDGLFSLVICPVIFSKGHGCERKVWL